MDTVLAKKATSAGTTHSRGLGFSKRSSRPNTVELPLRDYLNRSTPDRFMTPTTPRDLEHLTGVTSTGGQKRPSLDPSDERHPFGAYLTIAPGDPVGLASAAALFGAVDVGLRIPDFAMQQFEAGQPWSPREPYGQPNILGRHDVTVIGCSDDMFDLVTWGQRHRMDDLFYRRFCDDAKVYVSQQFLRSGKFPAGFNTTQLHLDLKALMCL
jgi:hypothetical protein